MSDGPHKSLPLPPKWKRVAKCIDNPSFDGDEVRLEFEAALAADWQSKVPAALLTRLNLLMANPPLILDGEFESLKSLAEGNSFANFLLDSILAQKDVSSPVSEMIQHGIESTLKENTSRFLKAMQEHWERSASQKRSGHFKMRAAELARSVGYNTFAKNLADPNRKMLLRSPKKKTGIDEGMTF